MTWRIDDPQGNESAKVRYDIVPYTRGVVLDLGCGPFKAFPHFIGVDNGHHAKEFGWEIFADVNVETCERLEGEMKGAIAKKLGLVDFPDDNTRAAEAMHTFRIPDASCDAVFSSHLLEHIHDYKAALAEWWRVIKPGGFLVLYLPHKHFYPNVGTFGANPDHKHDFVPEDVAKAMLDTSSGWDLVVNEERNEDREYSFLQVYQKREDQSDRCPGILEWLRRAEERAARRNACIVRYGGIGDMVQTASIIAQVKAQGFHVTLMTSPRGYEVVQHDPNIDEFMVQDTDQVPNHQLAEFWHVWAKKFDKFVNLSELVEGYLLAIPGRCNHAWPDAVRRAELGRNYVEFMHHVAETPFVPRPQFYPTAEEAQRVRACKDSLGEGAVTVMWALAGSSVHKVYPHMDAVIAATLMKWPDLHWVLVGGVECQLLERGWEEEPRVHRLCGKIGVRESLALAMAMDVVLGPETGVLNAVSHEPNAKIVMLSHSSRENLTRDWVNTQSLEPFAASCYPCHRLHYERTFCHEARIPLAQFCPDLTVLDDEARKVVEENTDDGGMYATGAALCAHVIAPAEVAEAIERARARLELRSVPA